MVDSATSSAIATPCQLFCGGRPRRWFHPAAWRWEIFHRVLRQPGRHQIDGRPHHYGAAAAASGSMDESRGGGAEISRADAGTGQRRQFGRCLFCPAWSDEAMPMQKALAAVANMTPGDDCITAPDRFRRLVALDALNRRTRSRVRCGLNGLNKLFGSIGFREKNASVNK
jgi:hypothetical protein